jgi:hypothetical protein
MFQGKRPLRTASPSCGRVKEVELSVNVQLTPPIARAGCLIQVVPDTIQDEPRESTCKGVTPGAADALGLHRLCDRRRCPDIIEVLFSTTSTGAN